VVAELKPEEDRAEADGADLVRAIRAAVAAEHSVALDDVMLVPPHTVPKTSSGKLQRRACRAMYESGELAPAVLASARKPSEIA
jgi:acyl-CoA synthetase (AMP-forming)/AMP-acid ligase II